jgi:16S rRNA (adenine1518-N6/adenine1519-N6)-dimethyltransferase
VNPPIPPLPHDGRPDRPSRAKKSLGQHFLVDRRILSRIVGAADLSETDTVVEIGPGRGLLTGELSAKAGRLVTVELDRDLASALSAKYEALPHVTVICADGREIDIGSLAGESSYKFVANLPYYAASPIIRRFLEATHSPEIMVVMVQREVAERMTASPGHMSLLSVAIQLYGVPKIVCKVPPGAFRPPPKVSSAVLRIDVHPRPILELESETEFFKVVRAGFSAPRKQLRNTLIQGLSMEPGRSEKVLATAGIDPTRRPQTLDLADWGRIYEAFSEH